MRLRSTLPGLAAGIAAASLLAPLGASSVAVRAGDEDGKPTTLRLAAGAAGGTYAVFAEAIAKVAAGAGLRVEVVTTSGTFENLVLLREGADLALVQADAYGALGEHRDFGHLARDVRFVAPLYREEIHVLVRKDAGIASLRDLAGKRVALGPKLSGTYLSSHALLDAVGLHPHRDLEDRPEVAYDAALDALERGELDAAFYVAGAPAPLLRERPASFGHSVALLPLSLEAMSEVSHLYWPTLAEKKTYPWLERDVPTVAATAFLAASDRLPAATVERLTAAIFENLAVFANAHPKGSEVAFSRAHVLVSKLGERAHPGALAYFRRAAAAIGADRAALKLLTGPEGGTYDRFGQGLERALAGAAPVEAVRTTGSFENVLALGRGEADLAIVQIDVLQHPLAEAFGPKLCAVLPLYREEVHLIARRGAGIDSLAALRGKRVHAGAVRSGTYVTASNVLRLAGLDPAKDVSLDYSAAEVALAALAAGELDAGFFVGGAPLGTLAKLEGGESVTLVSLPESDVAAVSRHGGYRPARIAAGTYPFQQGEVRTFSTLCALMTVRETDDQAVARLVHAVQASLGELAGEHPKWRQVRFGDAQQMARGEEAGFFHDGARRALLGR